MDVTDLLAEAVSGSASRRLGVVAKPGKLSWLSRVWVFRGFRVFRVFKGFQDF